MKKLLISLILLGSILISSFVYAITEEEVKKYLDRGVFVIVTHTTSVGLYGKIIDVIYIEGQLNIVLDTFYRKRQLMFLSVKNITYIRERKDYE